MQKDVIRLQETLETSEFRIGKRRKCQKTSEYGIGRHWKHRSVK